MKNTKIINCLVCGAEMEVDMKARFGMCFDCIIRNRFQEYKRKRAELKRRRKRRKK